MLYRVFFNFLTGCSYVVISQYNLPQALGTAENIKFSIQDFFSKCDQIRSFLRIWSHLLKKSLMENFIFCAVTVNDFLDFNKRQHNRDESPVEHL